jgi:hypothetical protein
MVVQRHRWSPYGAAEDKRDVEHDPAPPQAGERLSARLDVLGVDRLAQTAGIPFDGCVGALVQRENEVPYERSLVQGRLDILRAEGKARKRGRSLASLGAEALAKALLRHGHRPESRTADA